MARPTPHYPLFDRLFRHSVAVDLGTANTLIYTDNGGIVLNEPSVVAFQKESTAGQKRVTAVGTEARQLLGRAPGNVEAIRPMRHGVIANFSAAEQMIRQFVDMARPRPLFSRRAAFTLCVPAGATQVERRAIKEAAVAAGAWKVSLIGESLASAVGAGLPVSEATGSMVVDIGGGTTEVGVISLGGLAYSGSIRVGGDSFDMAIVSYVRNLYGVLLGEQTAEHVKKGIGTALREVPVEHMNATGRSVDDGLPRTVQLSNHDIADAIEGPLRQVIGAVKRALETAPAELVTDIAHSGIVLTGGGALLGNLGRRLTNELGLEVRVADEPLTCAVRGAGAAAAAGLLDDSAYE
ncbi:rod shape-determining protein [Paraburkholderia nemoris]|jgi:rod shape-determining protein MreB|uniref:Cell shape-determining protein MreB n=1 Tax=Paraburkholderia nemoris TaxID=2793076 RepID=A0ABM8QZG5_9BURK|nr:MULTISPECIES: rod shape-determining protein [Paraburkholderia]KPD18351.1 rod shape-determining protein MreB [Burkholderia sp. ST111]MBK5146935.1 rod shape-determining protein [Burkholderia sp. R-69608]MBK3745057.1 rod shape-determining protein [Paraburkholderia aspalathi]MBK3779464.1 rod shape-determining protein [Paraburkholderia aspalathi]MBK3810134.1 rod shape-determining protein [Paraburkholderia aspalathi]